jgi:uncharacterized membrane protein YfhO
LNLLGDKAAFRTSSESGCTLVFNTADVSGWRAFAGARPVPIPRANYAFLSVDVPPGDQLVWFERRAPGKLLGALITLVFALAALVPRQKS